MNERQLARAGFFISGETLDPTFWTSYFGVAPSTAIIKGQPFLTPSGKLSRYPGRVGLWGLRSEGAVSSDLLTPHLRYLVSQLNLPRSDLRAQLRRQEANARFFCFWFNQSGDRIPDVPDDIRAMMEAIGGTVEIDEYR